MLLTFWKWPVWMLSGDNVHPDDFRFFLNASGKWRGYCNSIRPFLPIILPFDATKFYDTVSVVKTNRKQNKHIHFTQHYCYHVNNVTVNIKICAFIHWVTLLNIVTEHSQLHRNTHTSERNRFNFMNAICDKPFTQSHWLFAFHLPTTLFWLVTA